MLFHLNFSKDYQTFLMQKGDMWTGAEFSMPVSMNHRGPEKFQTANDAQGSSPNSSAVLIS